MSMGWLKNIGLAIVAIFILLIIIGALVESPEMEEKQITLPKYGIYNLEQLGQPNTVRIRADVVIEGVTLENKAEIVGVVKKVVNDLKARYNAEVIWLNIYNGTNYLERQKGNTIADATWFAHGTNYRPSIPKDAEKIGDVSGGELWIDWKENWHDWGI